MICGGMNMENKNCKRASSWEELLQNAQLFQLDMVEMEKLKVFWDSLDKDFFRKCAEAADKKDFPMEEIQCGFSEVERAQFLFLVIVANYGALEAMCRENGFPEELYKDMRPDFRVWGDTLKRDYGVYGLSPRIFGWAKACLKGSIKAFGRLQCEDYHTFFLRLSLYREKEGGLKSLPAFQRGNPPYADLTFGDKCIAVHIPAGRPLLEEECIDSFRKMVDFFEEYRPDFDFKAIVCYSWLLDPEFQKLLKPDSNIVRFQKLGHNLRLENADQTQEIIWRIWGAPGSKLPVEKLSRNKSLEKAVAEYIINGGRFQEGLMVIFRDELPRLFRRLEKQKKGE